MSSYLILKVISLLVLVVILIIVLFSISIAKDKRNQRNVNVSSKDSFSEDRQEETRGITMINADSGVVVEFWTDIRIDVDVRILLSEILHGLVLKSEEPIARAIAEYYEDKRIYAKNPSVKIIPGKGVIGGGPMFVGNFYEPTYAEDHLIQLLGCRLLDMSFLVGNRLMMKDFGVEIPENVLQKAEEFESKSRKTVFFAGCGENSGGKILAVLAVADNILSQI